MAAVLSPVLQFLIGPVLNAVEKYLPDPAAKAQAQLDLLKLQQSADFKQLDTMVALAQSQSDVNKQEAASANWFVAGWRPFIGWICGAGLASQFVVAPFATWVASLMGHPITFPSLDMGTLITLLAGMLGLGGMRTVEKIQGASGNH